MAKVKVSQYDATAANNTDVANINIAEGCSPSNINNAIRAVMGHLKDFQAGNLTGNALAVAGGGTGAEDASGARTNLGLGALAVLATVDTAQIDNDAVTTAKIADANVTNAKMATDSVDTTQIVDDAVTSAKIDANAVDANALNVSGNGTSGQVLSSDGDGSFSWTDGISGSLGTDGYATFGNGLKIQWGRTTVGTDTTATVTFPSAFSTAAYIAIAQYAGSENPGTGIFIAGSAIRSLTTTSMVIVNDNPSATHYWLAIGV